MTAGVPHDAGRRILLAFGVAEYQHLPATLQLPAVATELQEVSDFFSRQGYAEPLRVHRLNPSANQARDLLAGWAREYAPRSEDVVVLYWTGHAAVPDGLTEVRLLAADADEKRFRANALYVDELVRRLAEHWAIGHPEYGSSSPHLLVILDCCYAEALSVQAMERLLPTLEQDASFAILSAATGRQRASALALSRALPQVVENEVAWPDASEEFLYLDQLSVRLNKWLEAQGHDQTVCVSSRLVSGSAGALPFFLNPKVRSTDASRRLVPPRSEWAQDARAAPHDATRDNGMEATAPRGLSFSEAEAVASPRPAPMHIVSQVYVSYRWNPPSQRFVKELATTLPSAGFSLVRDAEALRAGDQLSHFARELGRAERVVVVLSAGYLESRHCLQELVHLAHRSCRDKADFLRRVVAVQVEDLQLADVTARLQFVRYWAKRRNELQSLVEEVGALNAGAETVGELQLIAEILVSLADTLAWVADVLMPRAYDDEKVAVAAVVAVLQQRTA